MIVDGHRRHDLLELRKIVSARSTVTEVSMAAPVWSMP